MESDSSTTIENLRGSVAEFVEERSWGRYHTPKNLVMSIAIEAAELMELFQWQPSEYNPNPQDASGLHTALADELADVLIYCLALANREQIDLSSAVRAKMDRNEKRYPIGSELS